MLIKMISNISLQYRRVGIERGVHLIPFLYKTVGIQCEV